MYRLLTCLTCGVIIAGLFGCSPKPGTVATGPETNSAPPSVDGRMPPTTEGKAPASSEGAWKIEYGSPDAKVVVECFYPMEGHEWVQALNKKILTKFPNQVRLVQVNWQTDEGLRVLESKKLEPCGQYLVDGKVIVKKNPTLGAWKDEDMLKAVDKAVEAKYGKKTAQAAGNVVVHVPCGLAGPFGDIRSAFNKEHPEVKVTARIANTIVLRDRIRDGEGGDVFLCLGNIELDPLKKKQRIAPDTEETVALTSLSIITPPNNPGEVKSIKDLANPKVRRIALGNPKTLSVGAQAVAALTKCGVWNKVKDRAYFVEEAATLKIIAAEGKVDAALVYTSCLHETHTPGTKPSRVPVKTVCEIPTKMYSPVPVISVAITGGQSPDGTREFLEFCSQPGNQKIWESWGFLSREGRA